MQSAVNIPSQQGLVSSSSADAARSLPCSILQAVQAAGQGNPGGGDESNRICSSALCALDTSGLHAARLKWRVLTDMQAAAQGDLEAAIKEAEKVSAESKTARQQADELSKASNAAWEKVRLQTSPSIVLRD